MAIKKPIVMTNGQKEVLQAGDGIDAATLNTFPASQTPAANQIPVLASTGEMNVGQHSIVFGLQLYTGVIGITTIDWTKGNKAKFTFGAGNETLAFTTPSGASGLTLIVVQDSVGGRTFTYPTNIIWNGEIVPTLSTAANAVDIMAFIWDGTNYYGSVSPF